MSIINLLGTLLPQCVTHLITSLFQNSSISTFHGASTQSFAFVVLANGKTFVPCRLPSETLLDLMQFDQTMNLRSICGLNLTSHLWTKRPYEPRPVRTSKPGQTRQFSLMGRTRTHRAQRPQSHLSHLLPLWDYRDRRPHPRVPLLNQMPAWTNQEANNEKEQ